MTRTRSIEQLPQPPKETLPGLLAQLAHALAWSLFRRLPKRVANGLITASALVALATPLLLWVSWSRSVLLVVLAIGVSAIALCVLLVFLHPDDPY